MPRERETAAVSLLIKRALSFLISSRAQEKFPLILIIICESLTPATGFFPAVANYSLAIIDELQEISLL
jgi:hypothetical protein